MSNAKLTDLPGNNSPSAGAIMYIVDNNVSYQTFLTGVTGTLASLNNLNNTGTLILGLSGQFNQTGTNNFNFITGVSGNLYTTIQNLSGQFNTTGFNLNNLINGLSGQLNITGNKVQLAINTDSGNLITTGSNLFNFITGVSGNLIVSGNNLNNLINGLSGQLNITGSNLFRFITGTSGNLITTGSNLQNQINSLSGTLNTTGNNLINIINGLSGTLNNSGTLLYGYGYIKSSLVSGGTNNQNAFSLIGTPTFGSNVIPANGLKIGDVYYGEFIININGGQLSQNATVALQIQNNIITGIGTSSTTFNKTLFNYKIICDSANTVLLTPIASWSKPTPYPTPTGLSVNIANSITIDIIGQNQTGGAGTVDYINCDYSFLKKL